MPQFYVIYEGTEDTLASAASLEEAVRFAQETARQGPAGSLISILDSEGSAVKQFLLTSNGSFAEQAIARPSQSKVPAPGKSVGVTAEPYRADPNAAPNRPRG
jgi:hypothetical protein